MACPFLSCFLSFAQICCCLQLSLGVRTGGAPELLLSSPAGFSQRQRKQCTGSFSLPSPPGCSPLAQERAPGKGTCLLLVLSLPETDLTCSSAVVGQSGSGTPLKSPRDHSSGWRSWGREGDRKERVA